MRWLSLALVLVGVSGCSGGARVATDGPLVVDAVASDGPSVDCAALDEAGCLARSDCHAGYDVTVCDNPLGYCAAYQRCVDGAAVCVGDAACDRIPPTCLGPYVHTYVGGCYGPCARADQCAGCRADKLRFTQATGCENDGSVEFCVPPALEAAVRVIAPTVTCAPGGGRAGCEPATELLCFFPTSGAACVAPHGALTDQAWDAVCGLSMLPDVEEIVPTFFE